MAATQHPLSTDPTGLRTRLGDLIDDEERQLALASDPDTPPATLLALARSRDWRVRQAIADNPASTTDALLIVTLWQDDWAVLRSVTNHPNADRDIRYLKGFYDNLNHLLTRAFDQKTSARSLRALSKHCETVRARIVKRHPAIADQLTTGLLTTISQKIHQRLVCNPSTPPGVLRTFYATGDDAFIYPLAENPSTPVGILRKLYARDDAGIIRVLAANPSMPIAVLRAIYAMSDETANEGLAKNPSTPAEILRELFQDGSVPIVRSVASNPGADAETLTAIYKQQIQDGWTLLSRNPSLPGAIAVDIIRRARDEMAQDVWIRQSHHWPLARRIDLSEILNADLAPTVFLDDLSTQSVARKLIGSKHKEEVAFLLPEDPDDDAAGSLRGISALRAYFVTQGRQGKPAALDRHRYLQFLKRFNAQQCLPKSLSVAPAIFSRAIEAIGEDTLVSALANGNWYGRDIVEMLARILDHPDVRVKAERINEIRQKIEEQGGETWLSSGSEFHNFLLSYIHDLRAEHGDENLETPFYQARWIKDVERVNGELAATGYAVDVPQNARELIALGASMCHCVGASPQYAAGCRDGEYVIFNINSVGEKRRRGVTAQFHRSGKLLQVHGRANRQARAKEVAVAKRAFSLLSGSDQDAANAPRA